MVNRYVRDDAGYLEWLAGHPDGFVLNTFVHARPGYLVLHRAGCRTINRVLPAGSAWTTPYAKVCADAIVDIERWTDAETGSRPRPCGICAPAGSAPGHRAAAPMGRRPRGDIRLSFEGGPVRVVVPRLDGGPELVIEGAQWLAELFFRMDASALGPGSYDAWALRTRQDGFDDEDVTAINRTMAARSPHKAWEDAVGGRSPVLARLDPGWDLVTTGDPALVPAMVAAIAALDVPGRRLAVVTKMLHLKRPALVPVLDSLVVERLGGTGRSLEELVGHARDVARANAKALRAIATHLATVEGWDRRPIVRTSVRILDALLWTSHPRSVLNPELSAWRVRLEPAARTTRP